MRCIVCKGAETVPGGTTVTLERDGLILVVKNVPALICPNCGEAYADETAATNLLVTAEKMARSGALVDVRDYAAA